MAEYIQIIDKFGREIYKEIPTIKGINAETLGGNSLPIDDFLAMSPERKWPYRVQGNLTLHTIEYSLYVLDGSQATTTLTLPLSSEMLGAEDQGKIITLINPTMDSFVINGNGINIVRSVIEAASITLSEYQSIKLILLDIGPDHDFLWYELITIDIPYIKQTISLLAQTAAIGTTAITGTNTAGLYRVSYSLLDTTADLTAGTIMVNFIGTDEAGAFTMSLVALPLTALGRTQGTFFLRISGTGSVSYATVLVGIIGTSQYALFILAEKLL